MGGAPRNPAPRNHFLIWMFKSPGCHCTVVFGEQNIVECPPLLGALPISLRMRSDKLQQSMLILNICKRCRRCCGCACISSAQLTKDALCFRVSRCVTKQCTRVLDVLESLIHNIRIHVHICVYMCVYIYIYIYIYIYMYISYKHKYK